MEHTPVLSYFVFYFVNTMIAHLFMCLCLVQPNTKPMCIRSAAKAFESYSKREERRTKFQGQPCAC